MGSNTTSIPFDQLGGADLVVGAGRVADADAGDNKKPGHKLHDTKLKGNLLLRNVFGAIHTGDRHHTPPFFVFTKGHKGRDVMFRGLAVPGAKGVSQVDDLVAVWRTKNQQRFQNYRALFTILDQSTISRAWLRDLLAGTPHTANTPSTWRLWHTRGRYNPLISPHTIEYRTKEQQLPGDRLQQGILLEIIGHFKSHPQREYAFERCAAEIVCKMDSNVFEYELTRPWRDGGRDALGRYKIGPLDGSIHVEFAMEAKCKGFDNGSGVKETRLVSRLRHWQFGIFVTTSYVSEQAYRELKEDGHPVIIIAGRDIARILIDAGLTTPPAVADWLRTEFPC